MKPTIIVFNTCNIEGYSKDYYRKPLRKKYGIPEKAVMPVLSFFIDDGQKTLFNTGVSSKYPFGKGIYGKLFSKYFSVNNIRNILSHLKKEGIDGLDKIVLSHLHVDQISGILDFLDSEDFVIRDGIYAHPKEIDAAKKSRLIYPSKTLKGLDIKPLREQDDFIELPGHTPGHIGLKYGNVILAGDALETPMSFDTDNAKPPFFSGHGKKYLETLKYLKKKAGQGFLILSSHDPEIPEGDLSKNIKKLKRRQDKWLKRFNEN